MDTQDLFAALHNAMRGQIAVALVIGESAYVRLLDTASPVPLQHR